jgi:hypothetical protein
MPIFAQVLLFVGFTCVMISTVLVFVFKLPNTSALNLLAKGSFAFRDLQSHVAVNWVKPIYLITYIGLSCILIAILGVLIVNV